MKEVYQKTKEELFSEYGNSQGLNDEKASEYLEKYGENILISICGFACNYSYYSRRSVYDDRKFRKYSCNNSSYSYECNIRDCSVCKS